jgi:DNA-directed RNA polymerase subunit RPC12/RpoP
MTLLLALPLIFALCSLIMFELWRGPSDETVVLLLAHLVTAATLVGGWLLIWRSELRWTPRRISWTIGVGLLALVLAAAVGVAVIAILGWMDQEPAIFIGGIVWMLGWLGGTALAWRETARERAQRLAAFGVGTVACPTCGYNLTGLREARCPECGSKFTLDQLYGEVLEQRGETTSV